MKIAIIGATGFVGKHLVAELSSRQHDIKAFARNIDIVPSSENLEKVALDVNDVEKLAENLARVEVVVSAFNAGWSNPNLYDDFLNGSKAIQEATKKAGIKRLIVIGGAGSLYAAEGVQIVDTPDFPTEVKPGALAARDYLNILKEEQDLDWTFFSPAIEMHHGTSGIRKGTYRVGTDYPVVDENGRSVLSVEDVAVVIADEVEQPKHIKKRFTAAY